MGLLRDFPAIARRWSDRTAATGTGIVYTNPVVSGFLTFIGVVALGTIAVAVALVWLVGMALVPILALYEAITGG